MELLQNDQSQRKGLLQEEKGENIIRKQCHIRGNLRQNIHAKKIKPRAQQ